MKNSLGNWWEKNPHKTPSLAKLFLGLCHILTTKFRSKFYHKLLLYPAVKQTNHQTNQWAVAKTFLAEAVTSLAEASIPELL